MTPPPCNCAHNETLVVWKRGDKAPIKQRHDRCIHPSGPHPMNEFCDWRTHTTRKGAEMGWCSATVIFDNVCDGLLADKPQTQEETIRALAVALEDGDWDCQQDSAYWDHPVVQKVMRELHPRWFEDEEA